MPFKCFEIAIMTNHLTIPHFVAVDKNNFYITFGKPTSTEKGVKRNKTL